MWRTFLWRRSISRWTESIWSLNTCICSLAWMIAWGPAWTVTAISWIWKKEKWIQIIIKYPLWLRSMSRVLLTQSFLPLAEPGWRPPHDSLWQEPRSGSSSPAKTWWDLYPGGCCPPWWNRQLLVHLWRQPAPHGHAVGYTGEGVVVVEGVWWNYCFKYTFKMSFQRLLMYITIWRDITFSSVYL